MFLFRDEIFLYFFSSCIEAESLNHAGSVDEEISIVLLMLLIQLLKVLHRWCADCE